MSAEIYPISAGEMLRRMRQPGTYDEAIRYQQFRRQAMAIWEAARLPPVQGEEPAITTIREMFARATPKPKGDAS